MPKLTKLLTSESRSRMWTCTKLKKLINTGCESRIWTPKFDSPLKWLKCLEMHYRLSFTTIWVIIGGANNVSTPYIDYKAKNIDIDTYIDNICALAPWIMQMWVIFRGCKFCFRTLYKLNNAKLLDWTSLNMSERISPWIKRI